MQVRMMDERLAPGALAVAGEPRDGLDVRALGERR